MTDVRIDDPTNVRPRPANLDVTAYVGLWLILLYLISARQVLPPLGAIGQPTVVIGLGAIMIWLYGWLVPGSGLSRSPHPIRPALLVYLWYVGATFAFAMSRSLTELEFTGSHRGVITTATVVGVALLVADGVKDRERLTTLVRTLVVVGTIFSLIGIAQFFSGQPLQFRFPGLAWQGGGIRGVAGRSIFNRPAGTALHPIEFSVVTAALLPLAIHFALYDTTVSRRRNFATCAIIIGFAVPLAISRSGVVSIVVAMAVLMLGWTWRRRVQGAIVGAIAIPLLWLGVPGLVGTIRSLFQGAAQDPSITARIDRIPRIMETLREHPWFGRGHGTWSVEDYFLIDNQLWVTSLELGVVGMILTFALFGLGAAVAASAGSLPGVDRATRHLGMAVAASIAALTTSLLTFDALYYRILTGTLFLLLGVSGALWRLHRPPELIVREPGSSRSGT